MRICFLLALGNSAFSQIAISGKIVNATSREPISYANIGINNTSIGTLSNPDGSFFIIIPKTNTADTLTFSALGFGARRMPCREIDRSVSLIISLPEKAIELNPIEIANRRMKNRTFEVGNRQVKGGVLETDTLYAGGSVALLIDNRHENELEFPVYLQKASLRIFKNNLTSLKFRVRVNQVDPYTGLPGNDLLEKSIVQESTIRKGWLHFDFSNMNFIVSEPFFITFEQILDVSDRTKIADGYREFMENHPDKIEIDTVIFEEEKQVRKMIKGSGIDLPGTFIAVSPEQSANFTCYERDTSHGSWTKVRSIVTAYVTLSDQLKTSKSRK